MKLTKTDFLIYKDCAKNAWLKIHKPDIYYSKPISTFDQGIMEMGNDVDELARDLFPGGVLVSDRKDVEGTKKLTEARTPIIYQPVFENKLYKIICDMLVWNSETKLYDLYEVKASNSGEGKKAKDELYTVDIAFQYLVLKAIDIPVGKLFLVRLNNEYVRGVDLDINQLFTKEDFTERVNAVKNEVGLEMKTAYDFLSQEKEPPGSCKCIIRGRSAHCTTFSYSNPHVPEYSVHDIARIGQSKKKLAELVDSGIFSIQDIPSEFPLSDKQRNQVDATQTGKSFLDRKEISSFLDAISYPISFLDYETFPAAIPRFVNYKPFHQIPFQFSLHIFDFDNEDEPKHEKFIFTENKNPDESIINSLKTHLPSTGSILVWHKTFEVGRHKDLAERNPEHKEFLEDLNNRIIDLKDVFADQYFIHPGFKGKVSIKYVLPVLVPELSYKELDIQEGATASQTWNKIVNKEFTDEEAKEKINHLCTYCERDTYAMFAIWKYLKKIT